MAPARHATAGTQSATGTGGTQSGSIGGANEALVKVQLRSHVPSPHFAAAHGHCGGIGRLRAKDIRMHTLIGAKSADIAITRSTRGTL